MRVESVRESESEIKCERGGTKANGKGEDPERERRDNNK